MGAGRCEKGKKFSGFGGARESPKEAATLLAFLPCGNVRE